MPETPPNHTSLAQLQQAFCRLILDDAPVASGMLASAHRDPARIQNVYRNNLLGAAGGALALTYPVSQALVGDRFFQHVITRYIQKNPPTTGNLDCYGEDIPTYLSTLPDVASLPYLPDVAWLEWAWHQSSLAENAPVLMPEALQSLPPETLPELCFIPHPALRMLHSEYPVHRIWALHQDEANQASTVDLSEGPCQLAITRPARQILISPLEEPE